jgi:2-polyprenyl-3-methyl-5-hydroxy-6-metoxy-1,4-benzoquinol methylase
MENYREIFYKQYTKHTQSQNQSPEQYSLTEWGKATKWYIKNFLPNDKNALILDLGCGTGTFLKVLESLGYKNIIGVDLSTSQIEIARKECNFAKVYCQNIFEYFDKTENKFDLITGFDFIEHLNKNEILLLLNILTKVLKSDGRVIFQTPNPDSPFGMGYRYGDFTHELGVSPLALKSLANIYNFRNFEVRECGPYPHGFVSVIRYFCWKIIKIFIDIFNLVEVGNTGARVYTRVYIASFIN